MNIRLAMARQKRSQRQSIYRESVIIVARAPACPPFLLRGGAKTRLRLEWLLLALLLMASGCSAPIEVDRDNRRLVDAILTAITMKNATWLEDDAKLAGHRHRDGQLADDEYEQLVAVIETAQAGDWQAAEKQGYEFRKQHPFVKEGH